MKNISETIIAIKTKAEAVLIFTQLNIQFNLSTNVYEFIKEFKNFVKEIKM